MRLGMCSNLPACLHSGGTACVLSCCTVVMQVMAPTMPLARWPGGADEVPALPLPAWNCRHGNGTGKTWWAGAGRPGEPPGQSLLLPCPALPTTNSKHVHAHPTRTHRRLASTCLALVFFPAAASSGSTCSSPPRSTPATWATGALWRWALRPALARRCCMPRRLYGPAPPRSGCCHAACAKQAGRPSAACRTCAPSPACPAGAWAELEFDSRPDASSEGGNYAIVHLTYLRCAGWAPGLAPWPCTLAFHPPLLWRPPAGRLLSFHSPSRPC